MPKNLVILMLISFLFNGCELLFEDQVKRDGTAFILGGSTTASAIIKGEGEEFFITGETVTFGENPRRIYLRKYSGNNIEWTKIYGVPITKEPKVIRGRDGGLIFAGSTEGKSNGRDFFLMKTSAEGDSLWSATVDQSKYDVLHGVTQIGTNILAVGTAFNNIPGVTEDDLNPYYITFDEDGNILYQKEIKGQDKRYGRGIEEVEDGNFIIYGEVLKANSDTVAAFVTKLNPEGEVLLDRIYNQDIFLKFNDAVYISNSEELVLVGKKATVFDSHDGGYNFRGLILRTDKEGSIIREKLIDAESINEINSVYNEGYFLIGTEVQTRESFGKGTGSNFYWALLSDNDTILDSQTYNYSKTDEGISGISFNDGTFKLVGNTNKATTKYVFLLNVES